ncbi:MAG: hypothetical protein HY040_05800 [Planctomycetes bacterium]|nr:hypothetical protein [Planctomycetota bacterium]
MLYRIVSPLLIVIGLGLLGAAGYLAFQPEFFVEAKALDYELDATAGQATTFFLRLTNHSSRPVRVLGMGFC